MPVVRPARAGDARDVAAVHVRAWQAAYRGLVPDAVLDGLSRDARERRWRALLRAPDEDARTLVATGARGAVLGFCSTLAPARDDDAPAGTAEIAALYVDPPAWRTGIGTALLDAASTGLASDGWAAALLWVLAGNDAALGFYRARGFAEDGARRAGPVAPDAGGAPLPQLRLVRALAPRGVR
jgi:ribosomal protein S18 acetylase RimI-like enzyme